MATLSLFAAWDAAAADSYAIPAGQNLATFPPGPADGDVWDLTGSGIYLAASKTLPATLTIKGDGNTLTLNNGSGSYGYFTGANATLTLSDIVITGSGSTSNGGAIKDSGSLTVNVAGTTRFIADRTTGTGGNYGGAMAAQTGITIDSTGTDTSLEFSDDSTSQSSGGALYTKTGDIAIKGNYADILFTRNTANNGWGGAVDIDTGGGSFIVDTITSGKLEFSNNAAKGGGGAVSVDTGIAIKGNYGSIVISGNQAGNTGSLQNGGAFYARSYINLAAATTGDITIAKNTTTNYGGAFWADGDIRINSASILAGTLKIASNSAGAGGAFYTDFGSTGTIALTGTYGDIAITDNRATLTDGSGGAFASSNGVTIDAIVAGSLKIAGNSANLQGGAIYIDGGNIAIKGTYGGDIVIDGNTTGSGWGGAFATSSSSGPAGPITIDTFTTGTLQITNNKTTGSTGGGGGAFSSNNVISILGRYGDIRIDGNSSASGWGGAFSSGVAINFDTITSGSLAITNNQAGTDGGAFYSGAVTISGSYGSILIDGNATPNGNGAAIRTINGDISIAPAVVGDALTITNNNAGTNGGAFYASNGNIKITGMIGDIAISDNTAARNNGGAFRSGNNTTIDAFTNKGLRISGNTAGISGGAIAVDAGTAAIQGVYSGTQGIAIAGNTAATAGGAIYVQTGNIVLSAVSNGDLSISGNRVTAGNGGAFYASNDISLSGMYENVFIGGSNGADGNTATGQGGAFMSTGGNISVDVVTLGTLTIANNRATGSAGAFRASAGDIGIVNVYGNILIDSNTSNAQGGALWASGAVAITPQEVLGDITISNNSAGTVGGAIVGGTVTIATEAAGKLAIIDNRAATITGGAIHAGTGDIVLGGSYDSIAINNNSAGTSGGALYADAGSIVIDATSGGTLEMSGNKAVAASGGVASTHADGKGITIEGSYGNVLITDNTALSATAGYGGAFNAPGAITVDVVTDRLLMQNNKAGLDGGVANNRYGLTVGGQYGSIDIDGNSSGAAGGAFHVVAGNIALTPATVSGNITISNNSAVTRGGAFSADNSDIVIDTATGGTLAIGNNRVSNGGGGAFYASGNIDVSGSYGNIDIIGNSAGRNGGAIYAGRNVTLDAAAPALFSGNYAAGKGGAIWAGGDVMLVASTGDIAFTGNMHEDPQANAIYLDNTAGNAVATFDAAAGRTIAFYDPVESNAANGLVSVLKSGDGMASFDGSRYSAEIDRWSKVYGSTIVQAGTFEVANNAIYGVLADDVGQTAPTSFASQTGSTVQGGMIGTIRADTVTLNGDLSIAGRHLPATEYSVFSIATNSLTLGGGNVLFNTYLNDGSVQNTDLVVLDLHGSATSGQAVIQVTNVGGPGAITVGDGIELVETNGSGTTTGAFRLGGRVIGGIYEYQLYYGGNADSGGDPDNQNWYLRNTFVPAPTPDNPNPDPVPTIIPEVPSYQVIPSLAIDYGYAMLGTMQERSGELDSAPSARSGQPLYEDREVWCKDPKQKFRCRVRTPVGTAQEGQKWFAGAWARLLGDRGTRAPDNFFRRGPNYDYTFGAIQAGFDVYARQQADGTLDKAGVYVGYGQISSDVKGQFGGKAGSVDMDAYTLGGYWTHLAAQGWYTDAVVQATWYSAEAKSIYGERIKPDGFGILGSLEGGYRYRFGDGYTLEPQAQIVYQSVSFDKAYNAYNTVRFEDNDSLRGRVGLRLAKAWNIADEARPRLITTWLRGSAWHEFRANTTTSFGALPDQGYYPPYVLRTQLGGTWGEIGAGVTGQLTDAVALFGSAAYSRSLDNHGGEAWNGRLGVYVRW